MIKECLDILGSRSTQHLAIRVFFILIIVWVATYCATPANIYRLHTSSTALGPSVLAWHRAMIVTIIAIMAIIIALTMKGGQVYQDDLVFIAILAVYCLYWWQQWWTVKEAFMVGENGIGGSGNGADASILATGLSGEDWDNMAIGRTWTRDLFIPPNPAHRLVGGINRPEHYDFAPDDMRLYTLEPDLKNAKPSIELDPVDLTSRRNSVPAIGAGSGVHLRFAGLDGPLPDGRTRWHTQHTEQQVATVLDSKSRGFACCDRDIQGMHSDFVRQGWGHGREYMKDTDMKPDATAVGTGGLTPHMHRKWLKDHGYTHVNTNSGASDINTGMVDNTAGDEACSRVPRMGCGLDGAGRGECRHPHYCSNMAQPTKAHIRKVTQGGSEMLGYP